MLTARQTRHEAEMLLDHLAAIFELSNCSLLIRYFEVRTTEARKKLTHRGADSFCLSNSGSSAILSRSDRAIFLFSLCERDGHRLRRRGIHLSSEDRS
jgi:hypothetical protein